MITRIDPAIPMISPKGPCLAHFLIDNGIENNLLWITFQDNTGECWTWSNRDIRAQKNITAGREYISPFYDPYDVKLSKEIVKCWNCGAVRVFQEGDFFCSCCGVGKEESENGEENE